jgi:hypothetical protein
MEPVVVREIDGAHSAGAELPLDPAVADLFSDERVVGLARHGFLGI